MIEMACRSNTLRKDRLIVTSIMIACIFLFRGEISPVDDGKTTANYSNAE